MLEFIFECFAFSVIGVILFVILAYLFYILAHVLYILANLLSWLLVGIVAVFIVLRCLVTGKPLPNPEQ
ncbi:MAG: hypothetical protein LBS65_03665 [Desulfovibrio sp.]|nr:hypothetical protein [Desulfovibrio sp.]